jgi:hypothetical protein
MFELKPMSEELPEPELVIGSRFRVKANGKRGQRLRLDGCTGTIIGFAQTRNAVRVIIDGYKYPQTLHRSYLLPAPPVETPCVYRKPSLC